MLYMYVFIRSLATDKYTHTHRNLHRRARICELRKRVTFVCVHRAAQEKNYHLKKHHNFKSKYTQFFFFFNFESTISKGKNENINTHDDGRHRINNNDFIYYYFFLKLFNVRKKKSFHVPSGQKNI